MICDTSALLASLWPQQAEHERCVAAIEASERRVISPLGLTEIDHLIGNRVGRAEAAKAMTMFADGNYELASLDWSDIRAVLEVERTYRDLGIGLVEASLVVLAKRYKTN